MAHTHTCSCGAPFECHAPMVQNYDGLPDPCCAALMDNLEGRCEACEEHGQCEECGQPNQPGTFLCAKHQAEAEPPDPDLNAGGAAEQIRGGYDAMERRR